MVSLIDTNIIIRFLAADVQEQHEKSTVILKHVQDNEMQVEILGEVIMEVLFVMSKKYNESLSDISEYLKNILRLDGVVNQDKFVLIEALDTMVSKNIDFVDALICTKSKIEGYGKISFDKDVNTKC